MEVTVDDYVATKNGKILYSQVLPGNTGAYCVWVAILEKAIAKMRGGVNGFASIGSGGNEWDLFQMLTGKNCERPDTPTTAAEIMKKFKLGPVCTRVGAECKDAAKNMGLIPEHQYAVINVRQKVVENKTETRVYMFNPHGIGATPWKGYNKEEEKFWNQPTSSSSETYVTAPGFFWMKVEEFTKYFPKVVILNTTDKPVGQNAENVEIQKEMIAGTQKRFGDAFTFCFESKEEITWDKIKERFPPQYPVLRDPVTEEALWDILKPVSVDQPDWKTVKPEHINLKEEQFLTAIEELGITSRLWRKKIFRVLQELFELNK